MGAKRCTRRQEVQTSTLLLNFDMVIEGFVSVTLIRSISVSVTLIGSGCDEASQSSLPDDVTLIGSSGFLIQYLDSPEREMQEESAEVVSVISGFDLYKNLLIGPGIITPLIRVLECGSDRELGKEVAPRCLQKLTANSDNAWSVSAHGGVTAMLKICNSGGELIELACGVLKNLVGVEEIKRFMIEEGAISMFIKLAKSKDEESQINSIELLQTIAFGDESIRQIIIKDRGIRVLVRVFNPKLTLSSSKIQEVTLKAIENLCFKHCKNADQLWIHGSTSLLPSSGGSLRLRTCEKL